MGTPLASAHPGVCSQPQALIPHSPPASRGRLSSKWRLLEEVCAASPCVCDVRRTRASQEASRRSPGDTAGLGAVNVKVAQSPLTLCNPWTIQPMEFSRSEYWSGLPCPSPGDLPNPGIEPRSPALQADSLPAEPLGKPNQLDKASVLQSQRWELFGSQCSKTLRLHYTVVY